eukprot:TRINITY_DN9205_c0_g1_i1.p1 TRINITY_DN9205_c0_g1~~TRINITY_DN9205_c0_g1_i1.p1  ORF type:complete len:548 (+),score=84.22 TRINITY_DN9205_c0_g1_i1:41-1684(+)
MPFRPRLLLLLPLNLVGAAGIGTGRAAMNLVPTHVIFGLFCVGVPIFMAYNGGATAATVDAIQSEGGWSPAGIGLLGAMDKIGMTVSAAFWGYMLQRTPAKTLLALGVGVNASSVLVFSALKNPYLMYLSKLLIGFTEGLQWVWAPLWIGRWATDSQLPVWMNLSSGGVSAGIGAGLGTCVAGFSTSHGHSYGWSFRIEGIVLAVLWLGFLFIDPKQLVIRKDADRDREHREKKNERLSPMKILHRISSRDLDEEPFLQNGGVSIQDVSVTDQLTLLWGNALFCRSALAYACANFVVAGCQFLWIRLFMEIWLVPKDVSVLSFLLVTGAAGALGVAASSCHSVTHDVQGKLKTLRFIRKAYLCGVLGSAVASLGVMRQLSHLSNGEDPDYWFLALTQAGGFIVIIGVTAVPGLIQIICNGSVENEELRSFGTGLAQGINNFLGFAMGPLVPQLVIDGLDDYTTKEQALGVSFMTVLSGTLVGVVLTTLALCAVDVKDNCSESTQGGNSSGTDGETRLDTETWSVSSTSMAGSDMALTTRTWPSADLC